MRGVATAVRDYEYMTTHLVPASKNQTQKLRAEADVVFPELSFVEQYCTLPDPSPTSGRLGQILINWLPRNLTYSSTQKREDIFGWASGRPARSISIPVRIIASTILAVSGGALLIVPMVIMSYDTNRTKSIVTVSCSVLFFGFFLGAIIRSKSSEIFIATATYAAVLVVFVGTGGNG
jgi:hypothetical protein